MLPKIDAMNLDVTMAARMSARAHAYLTIDLCSEESFWTGLTINLSEGGVFVATHVVVPVGTVVGVHLELPNETRIMTLGEVRWSRRYTGDDDVPPGLGIRFVRLEPAAASAIRRFVARAHAPQVLPS